MTARPIDYSKWDHLEASDDDEENDEEERRGLPRVTHFDEPMSVTLGGSQDGSTHPSASPSPPLSSSSTFPSSSTLKAHPRSTIEDVAENGQSLPAYAWRQDKREAIVHVWVPPSTVAKDVCVSYDKESRHLKVQAHPTSLPPVLVEGTLANPISLEEEDEGLEWEVVGERGGGKEGGKEGGRRAVRLTFVKETPRADMVRWWSRVMEGEEEIDTQKIEGRSKKMNFQGAWEEAQKLFMEGVERRRKEGPVEVDIGQR